MTNRPLSRRAALKAMGATSLAMVSGVGCESTRPCDFTTTAPLLLDREPRDVIVSHILPKAIAYAKKKDIPFRKGWLFREQEKFVDLADLLWAHFERGVAFFNRTHVPVAVMDGLLEQLFETPPDSDDPTTRTGRALIENLKKFDGSFAPGTVEYETTICAFQCGALAAGYAVEGKIDVAAYERAWVEVSRWRPATISRCTGNEVHVLGGGC